MAKKLLLFNVLVGVLLYISITFLNKPTALFIILYPNYNINISNNYPIVLVNPKTKKVINCEQIIDLSKRLLAISTFEHYSGLYLKQILKNELKYIDNDTICIMAAPKNWVKIRSILKSSDGIAYVNYDFCNLKVK